MIAQILAAVTVAFPGQGQRLPPVSQCYMIGATDGAETNVSVQGRNVAVHPKGGWVTMVSCVEGTNNVAVAGSNHWFCVGAKPRSKKAASATTNRAPAKVWKKLPYASDEPRRHPTTNDTVLVAIDPGHGGADSGALSPHGRPEKAANLAVALALREELLARGLDVVMTREGDFAVPLYERPRIAHQFGADCFVSIHHNAPPFDRDPRGLRYTAVYAWNDLGAALASNINARMAAVLETEGLKNNGVPRANYAVTRNPEIPSCLVEVDFITSPEGEEACWNAERQKRVAKAIAEGIGDWVCNPNGEKSK